MRKKHNQRMEADAGPVGVFLTGPVQRYRRAYLGVVVSQTLRHSCATRSS